MSTLTIEQALQHHQAGRLDEAERMYRQILTQQANHGGALHLLAMLAGQRGRWDEAERLQRQAVQAMPENPEAHYQLADALAAQGRWEEAIASYREVVWRKPDHGDAYNDLGVALQQAGHVEEAIASYKRALHFKPGLVEARSNLGFCHAVRGQFDDAIAAYREALKLSPDHPAILFNMGVALGEVGRLEEAIGVYRRVLALAPQHFEACNNLANALKAMGRSDEAVAFLRQAAQLRPDNAVVMSNLGLIHWWLGQHGEARACLRRAVELDPTSAAVHSALLYTVIYDPACDAEAIAREHRLWNERHGEPLKRHWRAFSNSPDPERRLRIGYVSGDFREHVVGLNVLPLLREHDRQQMEVYCYSNVRQADALTATFQGLADQWREIVRHSDEQVTEQIRADGIDILVDLSLHTEGNRLLVFARKPAPVQVTFAGYPGTTGLTAIDCRLTDPHLDPPGIHDGLYAEKSIRLPDSFWCYMPEGKDEAVSALPADGNGRITFGCLNNFCKVNEGMVKLWGEVLRSVEGSRLILLSDEGSHRQGIERILARAGVSAERVEFLAKRPPREYMQYYHRIDIGLDTVPYNGHTTSLDALWMGVPVITLVGGTLVGRAGLSQLTNLGLTELIAKTPEEYVRIAREWAGDVVRLREMRAALRGRMRESALMDAPRFTRDIEAALREMWRTWCAAQRNSGGRNP